MYTRRAHLSSDAHRQSGRGQKSADDRKIYKKRLLKLSGEDMIAYRLLEFTRVCASINLERPSNGVCMKTKRRRHFLGYVKETVLCKEVIHLCIWMCVRMEIHMKFTAQQQAQALVYARTCSYLKRVRCLLMVILGGWRNNQLVFHNLFFIVIVHAWNKSCVINSKMRRLNLI